MTHDNHARVAEMASILLGKELSAADISSIMILVKLEKARAVVHVPTGTRDDIPDFLRMDPSIVRAAEVMVLAAVESGALRLDRPLNDDIGRRIEEENQG